MPQIPREPRPGERPDSTTIIQLIRYVRDLARQLATLRLGTGRAVAASNPRTLFVEDASSEEAGAQVTVSVGRIVNLPITINGTELGETPSPVLPIDESGVVYVKGTFDEDGLPTEFEISAAAEVPDDTETEGHKILAEVTVADGMLRINPVVWNLSEVQKCGTLVYLWGGFGD